MSLKSLFLLCPRVISRLSLMQYYLMCADLEAAAKLSELNAVGISNQILEATNAVV